MSEKDEAAGLGKADPITGVTGAKDDLESLHQLPDDGVEDGDDEVEEDDGLAADEAAGDPETLAAMSMETVTNDAVAGDTVFEGGGDGNWGRTGGSPEEITPYEPDNAVDPDSIDLDDQR